MKASVSRRIKTRYEHFKWDAVGTRFLNLYKSTQKLRPIVRVGLGGLGLALGIAGILLGLIPGVPGIVFGGIGFALVAAQFRPVARWADGAEVSLRKFWTWIRHHFKTVKPHHRRTTRAKPGSKRKSLPARKTHRPKAVTVG